MDLNHDHGCTPWVTAVNVLFDLYWHKCRRVKMGNNSLINIFGTSSSKHLMRRRLLQFNAPSSTT